MAAETAARGKSAAAAPAGPKKTACPTVTTSYHPSGERRHGASRRKMTTAVLKRALFDHLLHRCYVKLAPSRIAGVGVRAVCDIPPDTDPFVSPNAQLQPA